jgi:hypothetical protein
MNKTKKVIIAVAVVLGSLSPALASTHYEFTWHDNIRSGGKPRSDAALNAAVNDCYGQTGLSRDVDVTQAFKDCMAMHNYAFAGEKLVPDPSGRTASSQNPASGLGKNQFIDPDNGLLCTHGGWAAFCESPPADMTIHYTNQHGLNCTRSGGVSVCSSFFTPD